MSATVTRSDAVASPSTRRAAPLQAVGLLGVAAVALAGAVWSAASAAHRGDSDGVLAASLVTAWALAALTLLLRRRGEPVGVVVLGGAALAAVAGAAAEVLAQPAGHASSLVDLARLGQPLALALVPAAGLHVLAGLPAGRLETGGRRAAVASAYAASAALGLVLWTQRPDAPLWPVAVEAGVMAALGYPFAYTRYRRATEAQRRRLMWLGWAVTVGGAVAVVAGAMHVLVSWPP